MGLAILLRSHFAIANPAKGYILRQPKFIEFNPIICDFAAPVSLLTANELESVYHETNLLTKCGEFSNQVFQALLVSSSVNKI
jgi:hypothetical protein